MDFKKIAKKIKLDFEAYNTKPIIAKQLDNKSRYIEFTLYNNGELFPIDDTMQFSIYAKKPNGDEVWNSCEIIDRSKSKILFELSDCLIAEEGTINAELLVRSEDKVLTSREITIQALRCFHSENSLATSREYNELTQMIKELDDAKKGFVRKIGDTMTGSLTFSYNDSKMILGCNNEQVFLENTKSEKKLQLKNDGVLAYSEQKIYHEGHKPTPADIGAIANTDYEVGVGGAVKNISGQDIRAITKSGRYRGRGCINAPTGGDTWYYYDIEIHDSSWRKITAKAYGNSKTSVCTMNAGTWSNWVHMYSTEHKPTANDVGALAKTGGQVTGDIVLTSGKSIYFNSTDEYNLWNIKHDGKDLLIHNGNRNAFRIKDDCTLAFGGMKVYMDKDGQRPTPAEIGALPSNGIAVSASKLATARTISLTGDVTGSITFDGSKNVEISTKIAGSTVTGDITLGTYALKGANNMQILRDYGNGNVAISASKKTDGTAGEIYLGFNDPKCVTSKIRLCSPMVDSGANGTVIDTNGNLNLLNDSRALKSNGTNILRVTNGQTILSGKNATMHFRPKGDTSSTNQGTFDTNGILTVPQLVLNGSGVSVGGNPYTQGRFTRASTDNVGSVKWQFGKDSTYNGNQTFEVVNKNWDWIFKVSDNGKTYATSLFRDGNTKNYVWSDDGGIQYFNLGNDNGGYLHVGTSGHGAKGVDWWTSDLKLKENVESLKNKAMTLEETADGSKPVGLDLIDKIELFSYYHKEEQQQIDVGFIANQLEELDERLIIKVEQTEDSPYYSEEDKYLRQPKVSAIIPHLTLAIQQLNNRLNGLQAENIQLKKELSELKK